MSFEILNTRNQENYLDLKIAFTSIKFVSICFSDINVSLTLKLATMYPLQRVK